MKLNSEKQFSIQSQSHTHQGKRGAQNLKGAGLPTSLADDYEKMSRPSCNLCGPPSWTLLSTSDGRRVDGRIVRTGRVRCWIAWPITKGRQTKWTHGWSGRRADVRIE